MGNPSAGEEAARDRVTVSLTVGDDPGGTGISEQAKGRAGGRGGGGAGPWRVLKFGGTSVTGAGRVDVMAREIQRSAREARPVVVVSAFSGVTDALEEAAASAVRGEGTAPLLDALHARHRETVEALVGPDPELEVLLEERLGELGRRLQGVALLHECSARTRDSILATGEALSASILAAALRRRDVPARAVDAGRWIVTDDAFGRAVVDTTATTEAVRREVREVQGVAVVPGFTGSTPEREVTTLGRGGSDHSAAVLGVCLEAQEVEIWTDVDGVMTADPRVVPGAAVLDSMSFDELLELTHWGAKVVHPAAARLLRSHGVPLVIRNTLAPDGTGTTVAPGAGSGGEHPVRALASRDDTALLQVEAPGAEDAAELTVRTLGALRRADVPVVMVTQGSSEAAVCVVVPAAALAEARAAMEEEFRLERETGRVEEIRQERPVTVVTVVGEGMRKRTGIAGRVFGVLGHHGVNVRAIAQGASERNISVAVSGEDGAAAVAAVHDAFFAPRPRPAELWIAGTGRVGAALLDQLAERAEHQRLRVAGIGRSRRALVAPAGVPLERWREAVEEAEAPAEGLVEGAVASPHHPRIFVDCTASGELPRSYERLLAAGVSVVAANKVGFAGPGVLWERLERVAAEGAAVYRETTVGAGLPILGTVADLVDTGDRIRRLEGVLSGTLGYLCDQVMSGHRFSEAVRRAFELGYTEPDPRDDLSGTDVARKLVILARTAGLGLEPEEVEVEPLLPEEAEDGTLDGFWEALPAMDEAMEARRAEAEASGERLVYLGVLEDGRARVGLRSVSLEHPCGGLRGSENLVLVVSDRYRETPLVVRGPGAGPQVTAAGVFADVLRARAEAQEAPVRLRE